MVQVMGELVRERFAHESDQLTVGIMSRATSAAANQRRSAKVLPIAGAVVHMGGRSFGRPHCDTIADLGASVLVFATRRRTVAANKKPGARFHASQGPRKLLPSALSISSSRIPIQSGSHGTFVQGDAVLREIRGCCWQLVQALPLLIPPGCLYFYRDCAEALLCHADSCPTGAHGG